MRRYLLLISLVICYYTGCIAGLKCYSCTEIESTKSDCWTTESLRNPKIPRVLTCKEIEDKVAVCEAHHLKLPDEKGNMQFAVIRNCGHVDPAEKDKLVCEALQENVQGKCQCSTDLCNTDEGVQTKNVNNTATIVTPNQCTFYSSLILMISAIL